MCQDDQNRIGVPVDGALGVWIRYSALPRRSPFAPKTWPRSGLTDVGGGWFEIDLSPLGLADGVYEYEFVIERSDPADPQRTINVVAHDPYAPEVTRYAGTRGVFHIAAGKRIVPPFDWSGEPDLSQLPGNHQLVIYELPMRWVEPPEEGYARQVGLGTFDKATYEHLAYWKRLGINAIELTPVQDSPDTLNWGYGTRFFLAPDLDMGGPYDLKMFILECHRQGIRVILDVVMNHSRRCPLEDLAFDRFYLRDAGDADQRGYLLGDEDKEEKKDRPDWGGRIFRYAHPVNNRFWGREFHYRMASYWIKEYHIDGFRIDEFKGINNWDFISEFSRRAHEANGRCHPGRPFVVIAEDSWRRPNATKPYSDNRPVVDAIWDFDFQEGLRRLVTNTWHTEWKKPEGGRRELVTALLRGDRLWNEGDKEWREHGFTNLAQRVIYPTSHDVEGRHERRLWDFLLEQAAQVTGDHSVPGIERSQAALEMQVAAFALTCTALGIPMFLAGEEFAEAHDLPHWDWRLKMSDVVDWYRRELPGHKEVLRRVSELIALRCTAACLHWHCLRFFGFQDEDGFHPTFNENEGERVFAFCRPGNQQVGSPQQVIVVANCQAKKYDSFVLNSWPWGSLPIEEIGAKGQPLPRITGSGASLALEPFQVRVFRT
jgi:1,4-alpha-glucan branching enzyme